jgi:hypothetical protein
VLFPSGVGLHSLILIGVVHQSVHPDVQVAVHVHAIIRDYGLWLLHLVIPHCGGDMVRGYFNLFGLLGARGFPCVFVLLETKFVVIKFIGLFRSSDQDLELLFVECGDIAERWVVVLLFSLEY